jgi:hypothetical protein
MASSSEVPGYSSTKRTKGGTAVSGVASGGTDPTNEPGQYPPGSDHGIFGGTLPTGTGAPGTAGGGGAGSDPTTEPGQLSDGMTGISDSDISDTGAPGSQGTTPTSGGGPDAVTFTRPGSYQSGSYASDTVRDSVSGSADWTQANDDGYSSGGPQLPGIKGNEPAAGGGRYQPGGGSVLRGGRAVRP